MPFTTPPPNRQDSNLYAEFGSVFDTITANAGGGQTNATQLQAQANRVSTVASGADSVKLPPIVPLLGGLGSIGCPIFVMNSGGNAMQVFGTGNDTINAAAAATGVSVPAGKAAIFVPISYNQSTLTGTWYALIGA